MNETYTAKIKFFKNSSGFGFLTLMTGSDELPIGTEVFFHFSATVDRVEKDDIVNCEIDKNERGYFAKKVRRVKQ